MNPVASGIKTRQGYLELIVGPMFSGKTSEMLRIAERYLVLGRSIVCINHATDKRYSEEGDISTHSGRSIQGNNVQKVACSSLNEWRNENSSTYEEADVLLIDELQFYPDAFGFVREAVDVDKKVVIASGLDGDYQREPMGDVLKLISYADRVRKLNALCMLCNDGTEAIFTFRTVEESGSVLVGGKESYRSVCRRHYLNPPSG